MGQEFTKHQQRIIRNYYQNKEAISLQRLQELVTDLYLAEGKNREKQWDRVVGALEKLGLSQKRIDHIRAQDDPSLLAKVVEEFMAKEE